MILYIDMDDVTADFAGKIHEYDPDIVLSQGEHRDRVDAICETNTHIFLELNPVKGAIESINRLQASNRYEIYFLSTPMWNVPDSFGDKRIWLERQFGSWVEKRLILTHRKDLNLGAILIDDRLKNGSESFLGHHIHFGTAKYPDWQSILKLLL